MSNTSTSDSKWDRYRNLECFVDKCYAEINRYTSFLSVLSNVQLSADKDYFCEKIFHRQLHVVSLEHSWPEWYLFFILVETPYVYNETKQLHQIK